MNREKKQGSLKMMTSHKQDSLTLQEHVHKILLGSVLRGKKRKNKYKNQKIRTNSFVDSVYHTGSWTSHGFLPQCSYMYLFPVNKFKSNTVPYFHY